MEKNTILVGERQLKYPILQGGMGIGVSLHNLAGAVAKEGAIGMISAAQIGFREPDFDQSPLRANLRAMQKEFKLAKKISSNGIIGFNIMTAMKDYEKYVKEAVKIGADLIVSGAGLPIDLPQYVKETNTKIAPIVSTEKAAKLLLKYWQKKYNRTADLMVIEGPMAGGHLGFHREEIARMDKEKYELEIQKIIVEVRKYEQKYATKIPVFLAGGIWNAEDYKWALKLGAEGIQVGSRFVTTMECDASLAYKNAYIRAKKEDIGIIQSPVGMPGRAIINSFIKKVNQGEKFPCRHCHLCMKKCNPQTMAYCITDALIRAVEGDVENGLVFCGEKIDQIEKIETVQEVIASFLL